MTSSTDRLYHYHAYGLNIGSDMCLHAFVERPSGDLDVVIRRGTVQDKLNGQILTTKFRNWQAAKNVFLLQVDDIAQYLVRNGSEIWIERDPKATDDDVAAFLLGSALAALLQQRKFLTLHASAINTPKGAILFMGKSGVGKSTTLSSMVQLGFEMMTDDVSAITLDPDGAALLEPGYPMTRLWQDALDRLGRPRQEGRQVREELDKYLVPVDQFHDAPRKIHKVFELEIGYAPKITIVPMTFSQSVSRLTAFTFRHNFYRGLELQPFHFAAVAALAKSVECFKVTRPERPVMLDQLIDGIRQAVI